MPVRELVLLGASNPVMRAARYFGVPTDYAYLIADGLRAVNGAGVWPAGHFWHDWAANQAIAAVGNDAVMRFAIAMRDHIRETAPPKSADDHGHDDPKVRSASSISSTHCDHGSLFVRLHDQEGGIFAMACMDADTAARFLLDFTGDCEAVTAAQIAARADTPAQVH